MLLLTALMPACRKEAKLDMSLADRFEGKTAELITFSDSTVVASAEIRDGKASFTLPDSLETPVLTLLTIDGRTRAYYVAEPGNAQLADSMKVAKGTPLNVEFGRLMQRLDSVENLDDMKKYVDFCEKLYNENRNNAFGPYFGLEWIKYADPTRVDSLLAKAPVSLRDSRRARRFIEFAKLRQATAPGCRYVDFKGEDASGRPISFSSLLRPGRYTLVDFWASWCPYCIKELPQMRELYASGLVDIVGVAVRDTPEDTRAAVAKHEIGWPVVYNTGRVPYDIYGFSGIPHHILIGPDGTIVARDESVAQTAERMKAISDNNQTK